MSARRAAALRLGALAAMGLTAAACVEIASAENGVQAIRLDPILPSIIAGDTLRDSLGRVQRLRGVAFGESGDSIAGAAFEYGYLALGRDTATNARPALVVDPTTGLVRADSLPGVAQARVSARFGNRLQILDTLAIVRRPTRLERVATTDSLRMTYLCNDASAELRSGTDSTLVTASSALAVRLTGDSAGGAVAVPSYLVRYRIVAPATVPSGQSPYGDVRPALYLTNGRVDRPIGHDTTNASGQTATALRVVPTLLTSQNAPSVVRVEARVFVAGRQVGDSVPFRVFLTRRAPSTGSCP
ncbi:hypothetical protein [Roseisolibacter agri]|uniref:DUF4394 domain-containing protein n=1 Tax=Roseisolibacter agri TaxID=2014610 RepID=A0AA37Q7G0_9BACT|nr:hypothetical protein [Roseisolibacter agri]GLC26077.1 hypothetical protein rosag_25900 [Roseisolibacter agri]